MIERGQCRLIVLELESKQQGRFAKVKLCEGLSCLLPSTARLGSLVARSRAGGWEVLGRARQVRGKSWQVERGNSGLKVALIREKLANVNVQNILDVGCNSGEVSRLLSQSYFVVGIDQKLDFRGVRKPLVGVPLGEVRLTKEVIGQLPIFDAAVVLSVHHQWIAESGLSHAKELLSSLFDKVARIMFLEFAALSSKYGGDQGFVDNHEESVVGYAVEFLSNIFPDQEIQFLGRVPESLKEPYRFMMSVSR